MTEPREALDPAGIPLPLDYRLLMDNVPAMIWLLDPATLTITFRNRASREFGDRPETGDVVGEWKNSVHPEDQEGYMSEFTTALAERRPVSIALRARRADGSYRWVVDQIVPYFDPSGSLACYIGSTLDITKQVEAELTLRDHERAKLEQLRSLLPICAHCKKIRDAESRWHEVEDYVSAHMPTDFSHGLCPDCLALYEAE